jgi:hypothetical protein
LRILGRPYANPAVNQTEESFPIGGADCFSFTCFGLSVAVLLPPAVEEVEFVLYFSVDCVDDDDVGEKASRSFDLHHLLLVSLVDSTTIHIVVVPHHQEQQQHYYYFDLLIPT